MPTKMKEAKPAPEDIAGPANELLEELCAAAPDKVQAKLRHLHAACKAVAMGSKQMPSIREVLRRYHAAVLDETLAIAEQSMLNDRNGRNPYRKLFRKWQDVAEHRLMQSSKLPARPDGMIIHDGEVRSIEDPVLRHQVFMLLAENRSQRVELDARRNFDASVPLRIEGRRPAGDDLALSDVEIDAICDFINTRKLGARHLQATDDHGVRTRDGRIVADPGFITALQKIARSYGR